MESLKSKLTIEGAQPLWISSNKKWQIEKIKEHEIAITDGWNVCYAFLSKDKTKIVVDRIIYPKYVESKALKLAKKHIVSIYAN